jgi:hypothetical protein
MCLCLSSLGYVTLRICIVNVGVYRVEDCYCLGCCFDFDDVYYGRLVCVEYCV